MISPSLPLLLSLALVKARVQRMYHSIVYIMCSRDCNSLLILGAPGAVLGP
jgi:hypothetical protein